jgi:hypothetical protein
VSAEGVELTVTRAAIDSGMGSGLDLVSLFEGGPAEAFAGEITEIEYLDLDPSSAVILKVHDAKNLLRRVRLSSFGVLADCLPGLRVGSDLRLEALPTRDDSGKLWIATRIEREGVSLLLLGRDGNLLGQSLAGRWPSARAMASVKLRSTDAGPVALQGWLLDWQASRAVALLVTIDGLLRSLPWADVEVISGAPWRVERDEEGLRSLDAPSVDVSGSLWIEGN